MHIVESSGHGVAPPWKGVKTLPPEAVYFRFRDFAFSIELAQPFAFIIKFKPMFNSPLEISWITQICLRKVPIGKIV